MSSVPFDSEDLQSQQEEDNSDFQAATATAQTYDLLNNAIDLMNSILQAPVADEVEDIDRSPDNHPKVIKTTEAGPKSKRSSRK